MKKKRIITIALALAVIIGAALNIIDFVRECENIRTDVLRLHVVADSNSEEDQRLKLMVRDAVLEKGGEIFDGTLTPDRAESVIYPNVSKLEAAAREVLLKNGCRNKVEITVTEEFFATRCYDNFTMPAGVYTAVRVNIGSAQGKNWWCVMFPPLCLPAAAADADAFFSDSEMKVISSSPEYEPRFKIVEIYESIKQKFFS